MKQLVEEGLDKNLIDAAINNLEFSLREANYGSFPKGIVYFLMILRTWNYGGSPFDGIKYEAVLEKIKKEIPNRYFEKNDRKISY